MVSTGPHLLSGIRACSAILLHSVVRAPAEPSLPAVADHPVALPAPVAAERGVPKAARAAPAVRAHASGYSLRCRLDRKSVVSGKGVSVRFGLGGRRELK